MSVFADLFRSEKKAESIILVDVGSNSVAGAYAHYKKGQPPALLYTRRLPIEVREGELRDKAMLRALKILGDTLVREGAPVLMRATGTGSADTILISIDAPWQKTSVRTERFEQKTPFVFSKNFLAAAIEKSNVVTPGKLIVDDSIIGTTLNGYATKNPYGKKVLRASAIVLTSLIDERVARSIVSLLRGVYHTKHILPIAGSSLRYQAMHNTFPHEENALILDATGPLSSIALIRKGFLVSLIEVPNANSTESVGQNIGSELAEIAKHYPLPRTIFLLAREADITSLRQTLEETGCRKLWLSENPPKIVPVLPSNILGLIQQTHVGSPDLHLLFMALFWLNRSLEEGV